MASQITSELDGIVALIRDFKSKPLMPLFEALVNSIQAIEDRFQGKYDEGKIRVIIKRAAQRELDFKDGNRREPKILGFQIVDNGIGFTDENLASFKLMASKQKAARGGKGIGRFTWLKAFDDVKILSVYEDANGEKKQREIEFSLQHGIKDSSPVAVEEKTPIQTIVSLNKFKPAYRDLPAAYRTTEKIAQRILEHCLVSFLANKVPDIVVMDDSNENSCLLAQMFNDDIKPQITTDRIDVGKEHFTLTEVKLYGTNAQMHRLVFCADSREVTTCDIGKRLGTTIQFDEKGKKFVYAVYVTGTYLDSHVLPTRDDFTIPEESAPLDAEAPIGRSSIEEAVVTHARQYLKPYLDSLQTKRKELVEGYVAEKNPALRAVVKYCPEALEEIDPNSSDEKIDEVLYHHKGKVEFEIRRNSEKLLKTQAESFNGSEEIIKELAEKYDDFQKDNLAAYVTYRKFVIELFKKKIASRPDGSYVDEEILHDIIFPRRTDSDVIGFDNHNLWLIDDRLAFHACAMSDKEIREFMDSDSADRPDIVAFADVDPDTRVARTVSIIEFKKTNRTNYRDEKPPEQVQRMLRQIRESKHVLVDHGRPIHISQEDTQFLCYAICDFTKPIHDWAEENDYAKVHGGFAYYYYNRNLNASIYLVNLDQIAIDARKRNFAFFDKLGVKCT
ncbi:MAG: hypothetical protein J5654_06600 [Victivallales bacterium]|nr:hypothetical protein [Victivallales bacterium]